MGAIFRPTYPTLQRGHWLSRGLVAAWPFYTGTGSVLYDIVDRNNGTLTSSPTWVGGRAGYALNCNGSGYVAFSGFDPLGGATAWTVSGWFFKPSGNFSSFAGVFDIDDASSGRNIWIYGNSGAQTLTINIDSSGNASTSGTVPVGWSQFVLAWTGTSAQFYLNGVASGAAISYSSSSFRASNGTGYFGNLSGFGIWPGKIEDFRIWKNRCLSADEIVRLYAISGAPF